MTPDRPIVRSLLEIDLYKFTMLQALLHSHPGAHGEYEFVCRSVPPDDDGEEGTAEASPRASGST